jgi:hypothetical protein
VKKYKAVVQECFDVFGKESNINTSDFTIESVATEPMRLFVWLDYKDYRCAHSIDITLEDGTVFELSFAVAVWLRDTPWDSIRAKYAKWEDLKSDL